VNLLCFVKGGGIQPAERMSASLEGFFSMEWVS
jgi:hypothetical protein